MQHASPVLDSIATQAFARLEQAAHEAATSPWNDRKPPTAAQARANNYYKGRFELRNGLPVKIDNARGTYRTGTSEDGTTWANRMAAHYGDFTGTKGADGDAVDVFLGPFPESPRLWVINQRRTWGDGGFDEHKVMAGFLTEAQARAAYLGSYDRGWDGLESIVPCSYDQLKWWLRSGDCTARFTTENLPHEGNAIMDNAVLWDADANPVGIQMHQLVYDLRRNDAAAGLLFDAVSMTDLMTDPDIEGIVTLDALVVEVSRMSLKMEMLRKVMEASGTSVKATDVTISDPVRARGVLQVMVLFQMDDGQTISVWFHNPDTTPAKLTPLDELISWKWMLNKKDVTIVVAPERGIELNIREVARRVMRLVERNSDAFKRANEKTAARVKQVEELKTEITVLEVELSDWERKIEVAKMERDEAPTPKERWDSARGHAKAISKTVREEVLNGPQANDMEAFRELTRMLSDLRDLSSGTTEVASPEAMRAQVDELAVAIRAKMEEAAKAPAPAPTPAPVAAPAPAASTDPVLAGLGVTPDDIAAMADDGGYAAIVADEKLSLKWQDTLDSAMQQRLVDVRNALRQLGWRDDANKDLVKDGCKLKPLIKHVGAGANVVSIQYELEGATGFFMSDRLESSASELAEKINMGIPQRAAEPAPEPTATASPLDVFESKGGEPWHVTRAEWVRIMNGHMASLGQSADASEFQAFHEGAVKAALDAGKPVSLEVLADYPNMKAETDAEKEVRYTQTEAALNNLIGKAAGETGLTDAEKVVILASSAYKSAFRLKNAMYDAGISEAEYNAALEALNATGVYIRRSALTEAGAAWVKAFEADGAVGASGKLATFKGKFAAAAAPAKPAPKGDISYREVDGMFTSFFPDSEAGEGAWALINATPGSEGGKVLTPQAAGVIEQLRAAGYTVTQATAPTLSDEELAAQLAAPVAPKAISDAELEAAAEAGAEVRRITRNVADLKGTEGIARATLSTEDGKTTIFLYTDSDVTRAVKAVHDAEEMANFKPFNASTLKMPTAVQLGLNKAGTPVLITKDGDSFVVLDGWSNGHMIDLNGRPAAIQKALEKYVGDLSASNFARRVPMSSVEKLEAKAKGRATQVEPIAQYNFEEVVNKPGKPGQRVPKESVVLESADGKTWAWIDERYLAYFWKTFKGCEFFADGPSDSIGVRHHGKLVGIIMPRTGSDTSILTRAKRTKAKVEAAKSPDELSAAAVDAAYVFADATDAFKVAIAHSVKETSYSAFLTARAMDERAKALGLTIGWDVQVMVMDGVPMATYSEADASELLPLRRERVLDALVAAAIPFLPAGTVLDFAGDMSHAIAQLQVALDVMVTNEPINRAEGKIEQADLEARSAASFRNAIHVLGAGRVLDDASGAGGEEWETCVGTIKRNGEVIGRAVVSDGDGTAMVYVGPSGKQRVQTPSDGQAMWSDDDAADMIDWLVENIASAQQQAVAAIEAAQAAADAQALKVEEPAATGGGQPPVDPPAAAPVAAEPEPEPVDPNVQAARDRAAAGHVSEMTGRTALGQIANFMPKSQRRAIESGMRGEEKQYFLDKMAEMRDLIWDMPKVYEQDGKGGQAIAYLHYFHGSMDFHITERDENIDDQQQAYGLSNLGQGAELGYISIDELTRMGVELDLHWTPKTLDEIQGKTPLPSEDEEDANIGRSWRSPEGAMEVIGYDKATLRYKTRVTQDNGEQNAGPGVDADELDQYIRDDERRVREVEAETRDARETPAAATGVPLDRLTAEAKKAGVDLELSEDEHAVAVHWVSRGRGARGAGKKAILSVMAYAKTLGKPVILDAHEGQQWLIDFYAALGFTPWTAPLGQFGNEWEHGMRWEAAPAVSVQTGENAPMNQLRPLTPQAPDRAEWEGAVAREMTEKLEVTNSDAQGMMEAVPDDLDAAFSRGDSPAAVVAALWPADPTDFVVTGSGVVQPAPASTGSAADIEYLQSLIDGKVDMLDEGILARIEPLFDKYAADPVMMDLLTQAADAYSNAATAAAKQALSGG